MSLSEWSAKVPVQNPDLAWRIVDEEAILVDTQSSQATVLNPVGARIWELMDGTLSLGQIVERVLEEYNVDRTRCEADALEYVEDLYKRKLIQFEGETAGR